MAIFIFWALKFSGPSAIFFVLTFSMTTGMPVDPSLAPMRAGLALLGGALSWGICMLGWFRNPHGPETNAVKKVYGELAGLMDAVGTNQFNAARHRTISTLNQAKSILLAGYSPRITSDLWKRLFLLNEQANAIYLAVVDLDSREKGPFPSQIGQSILAVAETIGTKQQNSRKILQPVQMDQEIEELFSKIYNADAILNEPVEKINKKVQIFKTSLKTIFLGTFDKNSIVFISSLKYGAVLTIAALIAYSLPFERSYWVPLSCASVMSGATIIATFHRGVQRLFGTFVGLLIAGVVLVTVHNSFVYVLVVLGLTFLTELFIVRNYGVPAMFFTPSALITAEYSTHVFDYSFFAMARGTDILVGSLIGLAGALLIGSRSASKRLDHFIAKTIRSQGQLLLTIFSKDSKGINYVESRERSKMQTNLTNLITIYNIALGELFSDKNRV
jgi:uncharacterized membrane protein YccC